MLECGYIYKYFFFTIFALAFIYITNTYTKYKTKTFDNPFVYVFLLEVASVQLIEFFLWRNLKNKYLNEILSKMISWVITIQPITLLMMVSDSTLKYTIGILYALYVISYFEYRRLFIPIVFHTSIGKNGHLSWEWMNFKGYENIVPAIYLFFYVAILLNIGNPILCAFGILSLIVSLIFWYKYNTYGTMWCWIANVFLLYFIVNILLIQPLYEYNGSACI